METEPTLVSYAEMTTVRRVVAEIDPSILPPWARSPVYAVLVRGLVHEHMARLMDETTERMLFFGSAAAVASHPWSSGAQVRGLDPHEYLIWTPTS